MAYKDEKWRDDPGYCVECDNLRPLNKSAVCQSCWDVSPVSWYWYECWIEDEYNSKWYYERRNKYKSDKGTKNKGV